MHKQETQIASGVHKMSKQATKRLKQAHKMLKQALMINKIAFWQLKQALSEAKQYKIVTHYIIILQKMMSK